MESSETTEGHMAEEERGFIIRDRRGTGSESAEQSSAQPAAEKPAEPRRKPTEEEPAQAAPPITFLSFVYSMGTSALMLLGENLGEGSPNKPPNLIHAQEIIDLLTILDEKTKGNLTQEEETLLQEMLYTIRIKFVEKASASKS